MTLLFITVLNMSFTAGIVILALLPIRFLLKKAPRIFSYGLWAAVLFRLLCPLSFSAGFSLLGLMKVPAAPISPIESISSFTMLTEEPKLSAPPYSGTISPDDTPSPVPPAKSSSLQERVLTVGVLFWILGIAFMAGRCILSCYKLNRLLKTAEYEHDNIYIIPGMTSPFVYGIVKPRIYLPSEMDSRERTYILMHERTHIRRLDHVTRLAAYAALCLHWFNPLVWAAFFLSGHDMEISCDEAVLGRAGADIKKPYSASLLSFSCGRRIIPGLPPAFGETGTKTRIRHILRYKKPAVLAVGAAAVICIGAALAMTANPAVHGSLEEPVIMETSFYGIISYADIEGARPQQVVLIPGYGDVVIPEAKVITPYIETDFTQLEMGDLVEITFLGENIAVQETYPAAFSDIAESIYVMGKNFALRQTDDGNYLLAIPSGNVPDAKAGDQLDIYYGLHSGEEEPKLLASVPVLQVDQEHSHLWFSLSGGEAHNYLSLFGWGISYSLTPGAASLSPDLEDILQKIPVSPISPIQEIPSSGEIDTITPELLARNKIADGTYRVSVHSLSRSAKGIDGYGVDGLELKQELPLLAFSEDCIFAVNREMERLSYKEVSFDDFMDLTGEAISHRTPPVLLTFENGRISKAILETYYGSGIAYDTLPPDTWLWHLKNAAAYQLDDAGILNLYYTLVSTEYADIGDMAGTERIEIYTNDTFGDLAAFYDAQGNLLHTRSVQSSSSGSNIIYLAGKKDGNDFLMGLSEEAKDTYTCYRYHVFRLAGNGVPRQIAGSSLTVGDGIPYDDTLFRQWTANLDSWLADSRLLVGSVEADFISFRNIGYKAYLHN